MRKEERKRERALHYLFRLGRGSEENKDPKGSWLELEEEEA